MLGDKETTPKQKERKGGAPERVVNNIVASRLSDIDFNIIIIMMLKELSDNYKELYGSSKEFNGSYISMKRDMESMNTYLAGEIP